MTDTFNLEPGSFAFLHQNVFAKTCANSGCHDGNFEPDFRTISSAYNTLVLHRVIQNDDQGTYQYRVKPGDPTNSLLYVRLTTNIPVNASGMMPLSVDAESDWFEKKEEYIEMIKSWIEAGAPDMFGNLPTAGNLEPQVKGLLVFEQGKTDVPFAKAAGQGLTPIGVPGNRPIDIWLAVEDDKTDHLLLKVNQLKLSRDLQDFSNAEVINLNKNSTISAEGFDGETVLFTHKATVHLSSDTIGSYVYLRSYFQDEDQTEPSEIPNSGSNNLTKSRFTLKVENK